MGREENQDSNESHVDLEHEPPRPPGRKRKYVIPLLFGVVIGILLVTVALPMLVDTGIIKDHSTVAPKSTKDLEGNGEGETSDPEIFTVDVSTQITEIVEEVAPSVIGVRNFQNVESDVFGDEDFESIGSGVIYKKKGEYAYAVTNHHVIENADQIEVVLNDDTRLEAEIVGSDLYSDLAVLKMDGQNIKKVIEFGKSAQVKVGEPAIAIGNPLDLVLSGTVTQGVISGKERVIPQDFNQDGMADWQTEVIQTDAAINPGNSGGALINVSGQLIGINSMKINQAAVEGLGFAIPIDTAIPIMDELEENGEIIRPYLGIEAYSLEELSLYEWTDRLDLPEDVEHGVYIRSVESFSPADEAGLERFDVITSIDKKEIHDVLDLRQVIFDEKNVGDSVEFVYYRGKEEHEVVIELGEDQADE